MSGSSGSSSFGDGSRQVACEEIKFTTQLASPQPQVVIALTVGQVLQVRIVPIQAAQVLVAQAFGVTVGSLVGSNATRLRECILAGHEYTARVVKINGGQVTVDVEHE